MRKNVRVTPVHEKSMIIWNLNSTSLLCRGLNQIPMATVSSTSTFWEKIFLRWNAACSEIFIFEILITWIFYNEVVCLAIWRKDFQLNMQQVHVHVFLIDICFTLICSISSFPIQCFVYSFVNRDFRLNKQRLNDVSSSFMFDVRSLFISNSANHKQFT